MNAMKTLLDRYISLFAFVAVLALWEIACRVFAIPSFVLPAPSAIVSAVVHMSPARWAEHAAATLSVAVAGYLLSIAVALPMAIGIVNSRLLSRLVMPWLVVIQSTPIVAVAPIIVVTLGSGSLPRIVITMLISFFPLVISTATGLAAVPPELIELSRSLRAPRHREYRQIRLPYAMPYIFSALKVSITLAVVGSVVAEFVAAEHGLGYLILLSMSSFKVPLAFGALVILVASSLVLYTLIVIVQRRFFRWSLNRDQ